MSERTREGIFMITHLCKLNPTHIGSAFRAASLMTDALDLGAEVVDLHKHQLRAVHSVSTFRNARICFLQINLIRDVSPLGSLPHLRKLVRPTQAGLL